MADLQGCIPHGWRHTVEHLEDPTAYILQLTPNHKKSRYPRNTKIDFVERKGRIFTAWEVADTSFFKVD